MIIGVTQGASDGPPRSGMRSSALFRGLGLRLLGAREVQRGIDQRDMRERLWEISELALGAWVVLLGQKPDIVPEREQPLEEPAGVVTPAHEHVVVSEPEAAGEERSLARGQAIIGGGTIVAEHQAVDDEPLLDLFDGAAHARIVRRQESDQWNHEQARIEQLRAVRLDERAHFAVEPLLTDLVVNSLPQRVPALRLAVPPKLLGALDRPVDGHPRHHFRVCEMLGTATHLPHSLVRLLPDRRQVLDERLLKSPRIQAALQPTAAPLMQRVHHLAEYIEL